MLIEFSIVCWLENSLSLEKESIVLETVREKPRIFHRKLCSNHAWVVDTISASLGYPLFAQQSVNCNYLRDLE